MWNDPYGPAAAGALGGGAVAAVVLGPATGYAAVVLIAGMTLGAVVVGALHRLLTRGPLLPPGEEVKEVAEVASAYRQGYAILYRRGRPSARRERWLFYLRRQGRTWGYLDVDYMPARHWLYVENVYVEERHAGKGLGMALLLCAARTTGCRVVTTSARTRQGVRFFDKSHAALKKYGVELRHKNP